MSQPTGRDRPPTVDFLWRDQRLIVEIDGYIYHRGRQAMRDDNDRDLELELLGLPGRSASRTASQTTGGGGRALWLRPRLHKIEACPRQRPEKKGEELFLIDGNSLAYRAFFALPESIATADGRPTNAIYGFASMMAKILIDHSPRAVIVAWDKGWSGRENVYAEYKSQRKSRPDLLQEQWPHLAPLAEAFGFQNV